MTAAAPRRWIAFVAAFFLLGLAWAAFDVVADSVPKLRHHAILDTAYFSFALWVGGVVLMLRATPTEWAATTGAAAVARWSWVLGAVTFVVHVLVAFHFAHRWSHANAIRHVEETAGFGPGLFVSHFFTLLWVFDATWWAVRPASYARRPKWQGIAIHSFMAFITFNGTVAYGHGLMRFVCAGVFVVLGLLVVLRSAWKPAGGKET